MLLPILTNQSPHTLLLFQSSAAQSSLPLLRSLIKNLSASKERTFLFCQIYFPARLIDDLDATSETFKVFDQTGNIPGYHVQWKDPRDVISAAVKDGEQICSDNRKLNNAIQLLLDH